MVVVFRFFFYFFFMYFLRFWYLFFIERPFSAKYTYRMWKWFDSSFMRSKPRDIRYYLFLYFIVQLCVGRCIYHIIKRAWWMCGWVCGWLAGCVRADDISIKFRRARAGHSTRRARWPSAARSLHRAELGVGFAMCGRVTKPSEARCGLRYGMGYAMLIYVYVCVRTCACVSLSVCMRAILGRTSWSIEMRDFPYGK